MQDKCSFHIIVCVIRYCSGHCRREQPDKALTFVLLVDSSLAQLPLEALPVFSSETVHTVTRDFSLQMLCNRLKKFAVDDGEWESHLT